MISQGGADYPLFVYEADARLDGRADFLTDRSTDLGRSEPWSPVALVPISSIVEGGLLRVELRAAETLDMRDADHYRLRVEQR